MKRNSHITSVLFFGIALFPTLFFFDVSNVYANWCFNKIEGGLICSADEETCKKAADTNAGAAGAGFCFESTGTVDDPNATVDDNRNGIDDPLSEFDEAGGNPAPDPNTITPNTQNNGNGTIPTDGTVYGDKNPFPEKDPNNFSLVWGCNGGKLPGVGGCTVSDAIQQVQKLVNYGFYMSIIIMGLLIAYAGILYMTASFQGEKNTKDAKAIFTNTIKAFLFAAAAWAIVHFVLDFLVSAAFKSQVDKLIQ